jgi:hypothetical protein
MDVRSVLEDGARPLFRVIPGLVPGIGTGRVPRPIPGTNPGMTIE